MLSRFFVSEVDLHEQLCRAVKTDSLSGDEVPLLPQCSEGPHRSTVKTRCAQSPTRCTRIFEYTALHRTIYIYTVWGPTSNAVQLGFVLYMPHSSGTPLGTRTTFRELIEPLARYVNFCASSKANIIKSRFKMAAYMWWTHVDTSIPF